MESIRGRLISLLLVEAIAFCFIASVRYLNTESTLTLFLFNLLFAPIIFQLQGSVKRKLGLQTLGNFIGLFWNLVFLNFFAAGVSVFGTYFGAFYTIFYPLLNLMWVVPFWSFSLGVLPKFGKGSSKGVLRS